MTSCHFCRCLSCMISFLIYLMSTEFTARSTSLRSSSIIELLKLKEPPALLISSYDTVVNVINETLDRFDRWLLTSSSSAALKE